MGSGGKEERIKTGQNMEAGVPELWAVIRNTNAFLYTNMNIEYLFVIRLSNMIVYLICKLLWYRTKSNCKQYMCTL